MKLLLKNSRNLWRKYFVKVYQGVSESRSAYASVATPASYFANKGHQAF